jgi:hypothetical protein
MRGLNTFGRKSVEWIVPFQGRVQWKVSENAIINILVS